MSRDSTSIHAYETLAIFMDLAVNLLKRDLRLPPGSSSFRPTKRTVHGQDMGTMGGTNSDLDKAHNDILGMWPYATEDAPLEKSDDDEYLNSPNPRRLDRSPLGSFSFVKNRQVVFRYIDEKKEGFASIVPETGICTIWKSFVGPERIKAIRDLHCHMGSDLDDIRFRLCLVTVIHECLHSRASIKGMYAESWCGTHKLTTSAAIDAILAARDVPDGFGAPGPGDYRWREAHNGGTDHFLIHTFVDACMYAKAAGTKKAMLSVTNLHYLVVLVLLFCLFPQLDFTSGTAVLREEVAHTETMFKTFQSPFKEVVEPETGFYRSQDADKESSARGSSESSESKEKEAFIPPGLTKEQLDIRNKDRIFVMRMIEKVAEALYRS